MNRLPNTTPIYQPSTKNLPVLTVTSGKENLCIVLKNVTVGNYRLLTSNTGASVNLGVSCSLYQQCSSLVMKPVTFGKSFVTINVDDPTSHWNFTASPSFNVTDLGNVLTIKGEGMFIKLSRTVHREFHFYHLELNLDPKKKYTGIIGDMLHHAVLLIRKLKRNIPSICSNLESV
ncbi:hypothetical protein Btru_067931 [Bulinus truncatus]|nr:hypothetical protein Btru_067931 [Bulinus truncatus]